MAKIGINIATGSLQKQEMIVGIDLGTTNSLVAIIHPDTKQPVALKEFDGLSLVPSIIILILRDKSLLGMMQENICLRNPIILFFLLND
jgi:molecular chaperone HscA